MEPVRRSLAAVLALSPLLAAPARAQCEEGVLLDPSPAVGDHLGRSVGLSEDLAVAGAPQLGGGAGEALVFRREGELWTFEDRLTASDGAAGDEFGHSVDVDGSWAVVGAPGAGVAGAAYFFERVPAGEGFAWVERTVVVASAGGERFGHAVALDGDVAVVGDPEADTSLFGSNGGRAIAYHRVGAEWVGEATLATIPSSDARIGFSVDVAGQAAIVGAPGPLSGSGFVHYWTRDPTTGDWTLLDVVLPPDQVAEDGEFGYAVALTEPSAFGTPASVAIGAPREDESIFTPDSGAVHLYRLTTPIFPNPPELEHDGFLYPFANQSFARFGGALALERASGGLTVKHQLAVGAIGSSIGGAAEAGAAYLIEFGSSTQSLYDAIPSPGGVDFGIDVDVAGGRVVVGDWLASAPVLQQGVVRIYRFSGAPCELSADATSVSLLAGGTVQLTVDVGAVHGGDAYWVLGSASGTLPGTDFGGVILPVNLDPYTTYTLQNANGPLLPGSFGTLDAEGEAACEVIVLPGTNPGLAGVVLHHAALVFDAATSAVELATNPVGIELQ